jgi:signal transduction histidine kinase
VQEALANVAKHANGALTEVAVTWAATHVTVEVTDHGGSPTGLPSGGFGLTGLAERAALAGGRLETGPHADGWRVRLTMPQARPEVPR